MPPATPAAAGSSREPTARRPLRVLLLEDVAIDAELIVRELERAGFAPSATRVDTEADFVGQLDGALDVILADYALPQFDGLLALRRVQERGLDVPFIIVTGSLGDERAAQCIKLGVADYLLKDRLERLGLAVTYALEDRQRRAERKLFDEQLRQTQKMEAIGQLAGGIAHDFNNVLTVINGHVTLLLDQPGHSPEMSVALREIYMAGVRAATLTRQLLYFSHKRPMQRRSIDLNETIAEVTSLLQRMIGEQVTLDLALATEPVYVSADASMIEQVLFNLAVNARDAMPAGRITFATRIVDVTAADVRCRPQARAGRFAVLSVADAGCGIAPELLPRIFEPFFTTKEVGKGTGLGLATVFGIVQQHEGWVEVESTVNVGTTFRVFVPLTERAPLGAADGPDGSPPIAGGRETILVVEDDDSVRDFTVAVLQPFGYRVLQASSGKEALAVWARHASRIDVLLTDMVMPDEMSGPELAARLQGEKPRLGVIYTSGYSDEMMAQVFEGRKITRFVHKPYQPRVLLTAVRDLLDAKQL